jgi:glycosyltransferase involved in cell wall biosynthesis
MSPSPRLESLSIFFPFLNDAGTVARQIDDAYHFGSLVTDDLEVIALHGGASKDTTFEEIKKAQSRYPDLRVIDKHDNSEGYAVIKHGFRAAAKKWVFYTDGDAQYHLDELSRLVEAAQATKADIINGYKIRRHDNVIRILSGNIYRWLSRLLFQLPIRDVDCDFRLIRTSLLKKIELTSTDATLLVELIIKLQQSGARFAEIPVHHYHRTYGRSNYSPWALIRQLMRGIRFLKMRYARKREQ